MKKLFRISWAMKRDLMSNFNRKNKLNIHMESKCIEGKHRTKMRKVRPLIYIKLLLYFPSTALQYIQCFSGKCPLNSIMLHIRPSAISAWKTTSNPHSIKITNYVLYAIVIPEGENLISLKKNIPIIKRFLIICVPCMQGFHVENSKKNDRTMSSKRQKWEMMSKLRVSLA